MEMKTEDIDFKHLFKVTKIDLNIVTFKKYDVERNSTLVAKEGYETVKLGKEIGEEIHICKPDIIGEIAGKTGLVIKGFKVKVTGKKVKKVVVDEIVLLNKK